MNRSKSNKIDLKDKILYLKELGYSYSKIQKELKCSKGTISKYCKDLNISVKNIPPSEDEKVLMQNYYNECKSCNKVSKKFGYCKQTILKYIVTDKSKFSKEDIRLKTNKRQLSYAKNAKIIAINSKGGKCEICGYDRCVRALHFHHTDSSKKDFSISGGTKSISKILTEIDKCILVCSNCHYEIHDNIININDFIN